MFKKHMTPIGGSKGQLMSHAGKGSKEQTLPSRSAMQTLTAGNPAARTMQDYAKATPMASPDTAQPSSSMNGLGSGDWGDYGG